MFTPTRLRRSPNWVLCLAAALLLGRGIPVLAAPAPKEEPKTTVKTETKQETKNTDKSGEQPPLPEGVKQTKQEERTVVTRTVEERTLRRPELEEEEQDDGQLKSFGSDLFAEDAGAFEPPPDAAVPADYPLGPGDEIELSYWSEFLPQETHGLTVDPQGQVNLPTGGTLSVRGLTLAQLKGLAQEQLLRLYKQVKVHVALTKLHSIRVWVVGEAKRPGSRLISPLSTAFNALYAAGGPNERGSMRRIRLMRGNDEVAVLDLYKYLLTGEATDDLPLQSGDRLFLPVVGPLVAVQGEVRRPALYELKGDERLRDLLEWAGGLKPTGYAQRIQITRIEANARQVVRDVDASALLASPAAETNLPVQAGDVIRVLRVVEDNRNAVRLEGQVNRSGYYQWTDGMRVKDLLTLARTEGALGEAVLSRGEITRLEPDGSTRLIAFDVAAAVAGEETANAPLQGRDRVVLYSADSGGMPINVCLAGPVQRPGRYRYVSGMTVKDLLDWAGGLLDQTEVVHCTLERVFPPASAPSRIRAPRERKPVRDPVAERTRAQDDSTESWVFVDGRVEQPSRVRFEKDQKVEYYLAKAGGLLADADREGIRVYRANSDVLKADQVISVEPSDRLFVPTTEATAAEAAVTAKYLLDNVPSGQRTLSVVVDLAKAQEGDAEWNVLLQPGDQLVLYTPESLRWRGGHVVAQGEVVRPGAYERAAGMTVADLLFKAGGPLPEAAFDHALVERTLPGGEKQLLTVDLNKARAGAAPDNPVLQDRDKLIVFNHNQVAVDRRQVRIDGAVQNPGDYPRAQDMKLSELILEAGGLLPEANNVAEVVRLGPAGERTRLQADLARLLKDNDETQDVILQDYDSVSIATVAETRRLAQSVTIVGEVKNPGVYFLDDPETTLSDLLSRADGLTNDAFLPAATIRRRLDKVISAHQRLAMQAVLAESARVEDKEYLATTAARATAAVPQEKRFDLGNRPGDLTTAATPAGATEPGGMEAESATPATYVAADFAAALAEPKSAADIVLKDGDLLTIPERPVAVLVVGAVARESAVLYSPRSTLSDYLNQAGGFSRDARKDQIEIIRANGSILPASKTRTLEPGDIIFVPSQALIYKEKKSWLETVQAMSPMLSLAVIAFRR